MRPRVSVSSARGAGWVSAKGELRGVWGLRRRLGRRARAGMTRGRGRDRVVAFAETDDAKSKKKPPSRTSDPPRWAPASVSLFFFSMRDQISRLSLPPFSQTCRVTLISFHFATRDGDHGVALVRLRAGGAHAPRRFRRAHVFRRPTLRAGRRGRLGRARRPRRRVPGDVLPRACPARFRRARRRRHARPVARATSRLLTFHP